MSCLTKTRLHLWICTRLTDPPPACNLPGLLPPRRTTWPDMVTTQGFEPMRLPPAMSFLMGRPMPRLPRHVSGALWRSIGLNLASVGRRATGFAQERAWPRTGAITQWGEAIGEADIPAAIVNASYEAAFLELTSPGSLSPVVTGSSQVKREKVGSLEVEYAGSSSTSAADAAAMATPVVTAIEGLLWPFLMPLLLEALVV